MPFNVHYKIIVSPDMLKTDLALPSDPYIKHCKFDLKNVEMVAVREAISVCVLMKGKVSHYHQQITQ